MQRPAAARAGLGHRIDHALARQVVRQRPAGRLAPREGLHGLGRRLIDRRRRLGLGLVLLQLEQLQLELVEQRAALRRLAEPVVPQPGDLVLELLDQQRLVANFRAMRLPLGQQHRLQCLDVIGERLRSGRGHSVIVGTMACLATTTRQPSRDVASAFATTAQPAATGRTVRCGSRQSIPSNR